ncbi:hypothetical protein ACSSV5_002389, partial [Psychroflexus sp. MBR-150]
EESLSEMKTNLVILNGACEVKNLSVNRTPIREKDSSCRRNDILPSE